MIWESETAFTPLQPQVLHLWKFRLDATPVQLNTYWQTLSPSEKERANRFRFAHLKNYYIRGRGEMRRLLSRYLETTPENISIAYAENGKPFVPDSRLQFNLSHAKDFALLGCILDSPIGVDLEWINPKVEVLNIAKHFFSDPERETLNQLPSHLQHQGFFNCWTRKEAFIKAKGDGLSFPLKEFAVSLKPGESAELLATYFNPEEKERWFLMDVLLDEAFKGAVVVEGKVDRKSFFETKN